ncbi:MAG: hypothetical protein M1832_001540 [Thelocarpon impressellum]|nr:MAG: hypothetical protein M1832_001540 [Thelocarpon impressellum]
MPPKGRNSGKKAPTVAPRTPPKTPDWPPLQPLIPSADLVLTSLVPDQILLIRNLFTTSLCRTFVSFLSSSIPLTTTPGTPKRGHAARVNDRYQIDDAAFARRLWEGTGLRDIVLGHGGGEDEGSIEAERQTLWGGEVVGLNPNIRIYRYGKGQFFDKHYDDYNTLTLPATDGSPIAARTTWTLLLYLTSPSTTPIPLVGGETVFYPEPSSSSKHPYERRAPVVVGLETGMALLHRHGDDCLLHEGREVVQGEKWVLRSDLCVRR